jgi:hypothetical protein
VFNPWLALPFQAAQLGLEAQSVIALRLMRLAGGGAAGRTEVRLMVADKLAAIADAQIAAAATLLTGDGHEIAMKVMQVFKTRVHANKNRLSNQHGL